MEQRGTQPDVDVDVDVGWVEQRGTQPDVDVDVGWVEQRGTQQVQALCWVTLRCTQPTILDVSIQ